MARLKKITHKNADGTTKTYDISYDRFSQSVDGLVPGPSTSNHYSSYYLGGDGSWHYLSIPTIPSVFSQDTNGLVPGPNDSEAFSNYYLSGNGSWYHMPEIFAKNDDGLVPRPGDDLINDYADYYLGADVEWHHLSIYNALSNGLVPKIEEAPAKDYFLDGSGHWRDTFTTDDPGLVPANSDYTSGTDYLGGDGNWHSLPGVFTSSKSGLVPHFDKSLSYGETGQEYYLGGDGKWYGAFNASHNGLVPAPKMYSSSDYYLSGDGGWQELPSAPPLFSKSFDGLVRAPGRLNNSRYYLGGDNNWHYLSTEVILDTTVVARSYGEPKSILVTTQDSSITAPYINSQTETTGTVIIPKGSIYISSGQIADGNWYEGYYLTKKGIYHGEGLDYNESTWTLITPPLEDLKNLIIGIVEQYV